MALDRSTAYRDRWLQTDLQDFLASVCPDEATRELAAQAVAETMSTAHSHNQASWGVTRRPAFIRLNVGTPEALVWAPGQHALEPHIREAFPASPFLALMVDIPTLERSGVARKLGERILDYGLPSTPDSLYVVISTESAAQFTKVYESIRRAHFKHLQSASRMRLNPAGLAAHHPGLVDEIGRLAGRVLSQPSYVKIAREPSRINVEEKDLTDAEIDQAIRANRLQFGNIPTDTRPAVVRQRKGQDRLHKLTLENYGGHCAVCDVTDPRLLIASHVVAWSEAPEHRGDLSNVICLCRIHDALFEAGYWSLGDSLKLLKKEAVPSRTIRQLLDGMTSFRSPLNFPPAPRFIKRHRAKAGFVAGGRC
jgi:hypothetical protein